jgi:hypothetical protein
LVTLKTIIQLYCKQTKTTAKAVVFLVAKSALVPSPFAVPYIFRLENIDR